MRRANPRGLLQNSILVKHISEAKNKKTCLYSIAYDMDFEKAMEEHNIQQKD